MTQTAEQVAIHAAEIMNRVRETPVKPLPDQYEYKVVWISEMGQFEQHVRDLNSAGQESWKLVSVVAKGNGLIAYMERKL